MTARPVARSGELWAITSYFNPIGYRRRLANYRVFRECLGVPLAAIELSFDGGFELGAGDADLLVQVQGRDVMWQKERLLNLLLPQLPTECRYVAWLDCDIVFERPDWPGRVSSALAQTPLLQIFRRVHYLSPQAGPNDAMGSAVILTRDSLGNWMHSGGSVDGALRQATSRGREVPTKGMAWAAPRDLLERYGFYDACIVGGGTNVLACAVLDACDYAMRLHYMNDRQRDHYRAWATSFNRAVSGAVSCIDGDVYHLWHGDLADRRSSERHEQLAPFDFDPTSDIALADSGCWRWASDKPDMHRYVREYFAARREDG